MNTPWVIDFDVNETLSAMSTMADGFAKTGAPASLANLWFATLLRNGFALTAAGDNPGFARIGAEALRGLLPRAGINRGLDYAVSAPDRSLTALTDLPEALRTATR
ncbi:MAG: hypothetical protein M3Z66_22985 [Chloroflexota bacterium]|nr:hypothetical protein [Chloroflexota bacterium]